MVLGFFLSFFSSHKKNANDSGITNKETLGSYRIIFKYITSLRASYSAV